MAHPTMEYRLIAKFCKILYLPIKDQNESGKENNEDEKLYDMDTNLQEDESKENISDKPKDPKKRESFLDKLTEKLKDFLENAE